MKAVLLAASDHRRPLPLGRAARFSRAPIPTAPKPARRRHAMQPTASTSALAAAAAAAAFSFTPAASLLGGLTLGVLASSKFAITGRILGISGIVRGIVAKGDTQAWRVAFVTGMLAGGVALQFLLLPSAFEALPAAYSIRRAIAAGLLVGVGTAMGSGCTSGHGICGNSRLSIRSLVATVTFMASGVAAAYLASTASLFGLPSGLAPFPGLAAEAVGVRFGATLLAVAAGTMWALGAAGRSLTKAALNSPTLLQKELAGAQALEETPLAAAVPPAEPAEAQKLASLAVFTELLVGFLFALGLGVSGMAKPSKVTAFLAVLSGTFDPSLMLVMGGALLVSLPAFQAILRFRVAQCPVCQPRFELPTSSQIDAPLVLGALLFGAGWGVGGMCPGPALVGLATLQPQVLTLVAAMLVGMWLEGPISKALFRQKA